MGHTHTQQNMTKDSKSICPTQNPKLTLHKDFSPIFVVVTFMDGDLVGTKGWT